MASAHSYNMRLLAHHELQGFGVTDPRAPRAVHTVDRHIGGLHVLEMTI